MANILDYDKMKKIPTRNEYKDIIKEHKNLKKKILLEEERKIHVCIVLLFHKYIAMII